MEESRFEFYPLESGKEWTMQRREGGKRLIYLLCPPHRSKLCQALKERKIPFAIDPRQKAIILERVQPSGSNSLLLKPGLELRLGNYWQIGLV